MTEIFKCEQCSKEFENSDAIAMHNKAKHPELVPKEKKPLPIKKIRNWAILLIIVGLVIWGVSGLVKSSQGTNTQLNFEVPKGAIHWHPHLTIKISGVEQNILAGIGLSGAHLPIHTHEADGVLHMENNNPTKQTVILGYFFNGWKKTFNKDCIFDYCTDKGKLKMYVNGKENTEFENYFMQDKDEILIEYTLNENQ